MKIYAVVERKQTIEYQEPEHYGDIELLRIAYYTNHLDAETHCDALNKKTKYILGFMMNVDDIHTMDSHFVEEIKVNECFVPLTL